VPGIFSLFTHGLNQSIDFTGGGLVEISVPEAIKKSDIESSAKNVELPLVTIQQTQSKSFLLRIKPEGVDKIPDFMKDFLKSSQATVRVLRQETVGPILGQELLTKSLIAALLAIGGILLYLAYTFKNFIYGVSAIVALIHDLMVVVGIFSLLGLARGVEVDTLFVTAVLTTMSFSVHDTIVVFDRIREMQKRGVKGTFTELSDMALTQTMSRSLTNSVTIIIMLLALALLGGETIRYFALALLIGTISGTYSSPFVATPILILLEKRFHKN
jgi:preprotein translocase subunit SecF